MQTIFSGSGIGGWRRTSPSGTGAIAEPPFGSKTVILVSASRPSPISSRRLPLSGSPSAVHASMMPSSTTHPGPGSLAGFVGDQFHSRSPA